MARWAGLGPADHMGPRSVLCSAIYQPLDLGQATQSHRPQLLCIYKAEMAIPSSQVLLQIRRHGLHKPAECHMIIILWPITFLSLFINDQQPITLHDLRGEALKQIDEESHFDQLSDLKFYSFSYNPPPQSSSLQPFWHQGPVLWKKVSPQTDMQGMVSG